jgi:serine/threonine protein phosphatase PrpC
VYKAKATEIRERSALSRQLRLDVAQLTDVGRKRPHNEDNMAYVIPKDEQAMARKGALFIVADGMGGHAAGEVASEIAVDTVTKAYYEDENEDIPLSLINAIKRANTIIHQRADENTLRSGMGTTCVSAVLCGNVAYIANVGDSRAYIVHQTQIRQVSQDHSWVEEQVRAGLLTRDQARSHAQRNVITRCLGTQTDVEVDVFPEILSEGDTLVLCTDGLSGSIGEDDLHAILNQFVPQESVYHLVERANENGGPDNITAIVVRVLEVGADMPLTRYPVPAGHEADVDTAILGRVPTSSLGASARMDDRPRWNSPQVMASGPLTPASISSPLIETKVPLVQPARNRLLYPSVALIALLLVTLLGGGTYYVVHSMNNSTSQLSNARSLIDRANAEAAQNPTDALQQLAQAQQALLSVQNLLLLGDQSTQYKTLQTSLHAALQKSVAAYNRKQLITQLPCTITQSATINAHVQAVSLSTVQDAKGTLYSYALANDHNLYQLDDQHHLVGPSALANHAQVLRLSGNGQHLFALTSLPGQSGNTTTYNISMLSVGQAPNLNEDQVSIDSNLLKDGWIPAFLTSYGTDVYVVLTSSTALHQATILYYDANNWHNAVQKAQISISPDIVSVAAFPNKQLFLLTSDGHVKNLLYSDGSTTPPDEVLLQNPVALPLTNDGTNVTASTPIATPVPQPSQVGTRSFMDISGLTLLAAGSIGSNGNPHLYVVDNPNHRVMDLEFIPSAPVNIAQITPAATPNASPTPSTGAGAVNPPSLQLIQQFASTSILSSVKNATVSSDGKHLYLLTQSGSTLTTISSLDKAPSCS